MPTLKQIKDELVSLVEAVQYGGGDAFANVFGYPTDEFTGYPNAVIVQTTGDSEHATTKDNHRIDSFEIHIFISLDDEGVTKETATDYCYELMELVRNEIDNRENLSLNGVLYASPAANGLTIGNVNNGLNVIGTVSVEVRHLYSIT